MSRLAPFYITLPSDASWATYPQNNAAEWTTKLPHPISLPGKWEVGLVEFHYVNSLYAVREGIDTMEIFVIDSIHQLENNDFTVKEIHHTVKIPPGTYKNGQALLDAISKAIPSLTDDYYFYSKNDATPLQLSDKPASQNAALLRLSFLSPDQEKTIATLASMRVRVTFPKQSRLKAMLGFDENDTLAYRKIPDTTAVAQYIYDKLAASSFLKSTPLPLENLQIISSRAYNPNVGTQELYVYCDVADYGIVGETSSQILRAVPIRGELNMLVENRFDFPHYVPVLKTYFDNIHLIIADEVGANAKFHSGKTLIKLHFRPQRPY